MTYNSNNLKGTEIFKTWDGSSYINEDKTEYTYNSNLNIETEEMYDWNDSGNSWNNTSIITYIYSNDKLDYTIETYPDIPSNNKKKIYI